MVDIPAAAGRLLKAYETGDTIAPLTDQWPDLSIDEAYAIQEHQLGVWQESGDTVVGYKVGLTSRAMQRMLGVHEPDFGHVLQSGRYDTGAEVPLDRFLQPRIEPEVAFVLGAPLSGPGLDIVTASSAISAILPAIEIIDSRIADWRIKLPDTIADNASGGGVVLGTPVAPAPRSLDLLGCNVWRAGVVAATGISGAVLGHPLLGLVWLANALGERGVTLEAGAVVLSGACTGAVPVAAGETIAVDFHELGSVTATFSSDVGGSAS